MKARMLGWIGEINASRWFLYANMILCFALLNLAATRLNCRLDLSRGASNSLTASTEKVLDRLKEPVLIEAYVTRSVPGFILSRVNAIVGQLEEIDRVGGDQVQLRLIDPITEAEQQRAVARGVEGTFLEEARVDSETIRRGFFGLYLQMGDRTANINLVDPERGDLVNDLEYRFLREIKSMLRERGESSIGFVQAPGTTPARAWQRYADQNKDNLFAFKQIAETDLPPFQDIQLDARVPFAIKTLLLVGLPRLEPTEVYHLDQFLMRGGSLVCLLKGFDFQPRPPRDPRTGRGQQGGGFATVPENELNALNEWLGRYGITVNGEILLEPEAAVAARDIQGQFMVKVANPAWAFYDRANNNLADGNPAIAPIQQLVLPWFSGLDVKESVQPDVRFTVLVESNPSAISRQSSNLDLQELQNLGATVTDTAVGRRVPLAVHASGRFKSRFQAGDLPEGIDSAGFIANQTGTDVSNITVIGTPYMVADMLVAERTRSEANLQIFQINSAFLINLLEVSGGDWDLLEVRSRVKQIAYLDNLALVFGPGLGGLLEFLFMWFHILFVPAALAIYGAIHLMARNRRRGLEPGSLSQGDAQ